MDDIREWISDNLRYIILIIAVLMLVVIGVFSVRAIKHVGGNKNKTEKTAVTEKQTEGTSEAVTEGTTTTTLVQNDAKVLTMMTSYYTARTNKDIETILKLDPSTSEEVETENLNNSSVESYSNIKTYSVAGPTEGSVVVYACYDGKVKDIDTLVPSLTQYFLKTNTEGQYYIAEPTEEENTFIDKVKSSDEVTQLLEQVKKACDDATASDPVLKEFMSKFGNTQSGSSTAKSDDDDDDDDDDLKTEELDEEIMYATDTCNVRSVPSADSADTVIGGVTYGEEVVVTGKSGDWYQIEFNGQEAYVSAEFIATEKEFYGTTDDEDSEDADDIEGLDESEEDDTTV